MKNNKGFTLVELLATLIVLALVMTLGGYSITSIIKNSKEKNCELLISNIKDAAESYYNECKYMPTKKCDDENEDGEEVYKVSLSDLVSSGFLKGNSEDDSTSNKVKNPVNNEYISDCEIKITKIDGKINIIGEEKTDIKCPYISQYDICKDEEE